MPDLGRREEASADRGVAVRAPDGRARVFGRGVELLANGVAYYPLLALAVVLLFGLYYDRWPGAASFGTPISYAEGGDVLLVLGIAKGFSALPPPWDLNVPLLNAPFGADWNDYPHTEKLIFYPWGLVLRWMDSGSAANLFVAISHLSAATSFAWVARRLGRGPLIAACGALLFSFSHFVVGRALGHLNVAYVWHLPLLLYLVVRLATLEQIPSRRVQLGAAAVLVATSLQNPYYPPLAFQLVALATAVAWSKRRRRVAAFGAVLVLVAVASFLLGQFNVFLRSWTAGPNTMFSGRSLEAIRIWALRLPDLFFPWTHPFKPWESFARSHYFEAGNPGTENSFAFLGLVACVLLVALTVVAVSRGMSGKFRDIPWEAWVVGYVLAFSVSGGLDYLVGALGITWLRAVNRYSIVVQCAVLLWGCRVLEQHHRRSLRAVVMTLALSASLFEFFGDRPADFDKRHELIRKTIASDRKFARTLEKNLPGNAAVFQLPVMPFPESFPVRGMPDCHHFRPFLFTRNLRFSYGTHKGRQRELWQKHAEQLSPHKMAAYLADHGFDALFINRRGLGDLAPWFEGALRADKVERIAESGTRDMVAYRLDRTGEKLPRDFVSLGLEQGFPWGWERGQGGSDEFAWSDGDAKLRLITSRAGTRHRVSFAVESLTQAQLDAYVGGGIVSSTLVLVGRVIPVTFELTPATGETFIELRSSAPARRPDNGDKRKLGFRIVNPGATPAGEK